VKRKFLETNAHYMLSGFFFFFLDFGDKEEETKWSYLQVNPVGECNLLFQANCVKNRVFFRLLNDLFFRRPDEFVQLSFHVVLNLQLSV